MAEAFITAEDDVDVKVKQEGIDNDNQDNDEDDEDAVVLEIKSDDPEFKWKKAKEDKGMKSPSMDKLMNLTGMKEIKTVAISICLDALNARDRPKHIKAGRSMNFLFVGNPGKCGVSFRLLSHTNCLYDYDYRLDCTFGSCKALEKRLLLSYWLLQW